MMRWKMLALVPVLIWAMVLPARAATQQEEILSAQEQALDVDELERAAGQTGSEIDYGTGLEQGLGQILDTGSQELVGIVRGAVRAGVLSLLGAGVILVTVTARVIYGLAQDGKQAGKTAV